MVRLSNVLVMFDLAHRRRVAALCMLYNFKIHRICSQVLRVDLPRRHGPVRLTRQGVSGHNICSMVSSSADLVFLSLWMGLFLDCCCIDKYNQINYFWNVKYCQKVNISKNARILYIKGSLIWMIILLINLTKFNFELIVNLQNPMQFLLKCQLILTFLMQLRVIPEGHLFLQFLVFVKLGFVKF